MQEVSAEHILELAAGRFAHAEVFEEVGESVSVSFEDSRLKEITVSQFRGVGLRVIHEGRIGFASTTDLRDPDRLIEMAAASAQYGDEAKFDLPGAPEHLRRTQTWDDAVPQVTAEQMVEMGRAGLAMASEANESYLFYADISRSVHRQRLLNTGGLDFESTSTGMSAHAGILEVNDDGMLQVYESKSWGHPVDGILDLTGTVLDKARQAAVTAPARQEKMSVIFTPKAVGNLLGPVGIALNGRHVHKGSSVLRGRVGEQVLDERITVTDDPTVPFAPGTCALDDEGTPTAKRHLFENGVLRGYLTDRHTAGLLGCEPSGNGFRGYAGRPMPSTTNTVVAAGDTPYEEMIAGLKRGVIVDETLGSGQSNVLAGEFSVNLSLGFLVEDGKIVGRVKDCMVAGNVYELLRDRLEAVGSEQQWLGGSCRPAIMVGGIALATSQ